MAPAVHREADVGIRQGVGKVKLVTRAMIRGEDLGLLKRTVASASAVMQQSGSIVVDNRHARTLRLNKSITARTLLDVPFEDIGGLCGYAEFPEAVPQARM